MKPYMWLPCIACVFLASACAATIITPVQAKAAVRTFENNSALELSDPVLRTDTDAPAWAQLDLYSMTHLDTGGAADSSWSVDAVSGEVLDARHEYAFPSTEYDESPGPFTESECQQIASDFAHAHYSGFASLNMQPNENYWKRTGWEFEWRETLPSSATTPNCVFVEVNPADGAIQAYRALRIPTPSPPAAQMTAEQAVAVISQEYELSNAAAGSPPNLCADASGIYWFLEVEAADPDGSPFSCFATVNAVTGAITSCDVAQLAPQPPVCCAVPSGSSTDSRVGLRKLVASMPKASVAWLGKGIAKLLVGRHVCILRAGYSEVKLDGKPIRLSGKVTIKSGMMMVPPDLLDHLRAKPLAREKRSPQR